MHWLFELCFARKVFLNIYNCKKYALCKYVAKEEKNNIRRPFLSMWCEDKMLGRTISSFRSWPQTSHVCWLNKRCSRFLPFRFLPFGTNPGSSFWQSWKFPASIWQISWDLLTLYNTDSSLWERGPVSRANPGWGIRQMWLRLTNLQFITRPE